MFDVCIIDLGFFRYKSLQLFITNSWIDLFIILPGLFNIKLKQARITFDLILPLLHLFYFIEVDFQSLASQSLIEFSE